MSDRTELTDEAVEEAARRQVRAMLETIPNHRTRWDAEQWLLYGRPSGGFFMAMVRDRLVESFQLADAHNIQLMRRWAAWLHGACPSDARGDRTVAWNRTGGMIGWCRRVMSEEAGSGSSEPPLPLDESRPPA